MNKLFIGLTIVILAVFGYLYIEGGKVSYVATVGDEVSALETELAEIEAQVAAGALSVEDANVARAKIVTRLETINAAVQSAEKKTLTPEQRQALLEGLDRFKGVLAKYRATLDVVEETATDTPTLSRGSGGGRTIVDAVQNVLDVVEEHVEEMVENYVPEEVDDELMEEEVSSSTDETGGVSDDVEDDTVSEEEGGTMEDESGDTMSDDTGVSDADAEESVTDEVSGDTEEEVTTTTN